MLSDDARKVLLIVWSMYRSEWANYTKDIPVICRRSGRTERRARDALNELVKLGYLEHKEGHTRVLFASELQREKQMTAAWRDRY